MQSFFRPLVAILPLFATTIVSCKSANDLSHASSTELQDRLDLPYHDPYGEGYLDRNEVSDADAKHGAATLIRRLTAQSRYWSQRAVQVEFGTSPGLDYFASGRKLSDDNPFLAVVVSPLLTKAGLDDCRGYVTFELKVGADGKYTWRFHDKEPEMVVTCIPTLINGDFLGDYVKGPGQRVPPTFRAPVVQIDSGKNSLDAINTVLGMPSFQSDVAPGVAFDSWIDSMDGNGSAADGAEMRAVALKNNLVKSRLAAVPVWIDRSAATMQQNDTRSVYIARLPRNLRVLRWEKLPAPSTLQTVTDWLREKKGMVFGDSNGSSYNFDIPQDFLPDLPNPVSTFLYLCYGPNSQEYTDWLRNSK